MTRNWRACKPVALHLTLKVNFAPIGRLEAVRLYPRDLPAEPADVVGTYAAEVVGSRGGWSGRVEHRYGDGSWVLVQKILEAYNRQ